MTQLEYRVVIYINFSKNFCILEKSKISFPKISKTICVKGKDSKMFTFCHQKMHNQSLEMGEKKLLLHTSVQHKYGASPSNLINSGV